MEAVGRLARGVAHDFNNLLGVILANSELLLKDVPSGRHLRKRIKEIKLASETATQVTRQLLTFSRQEALEPEVMDLNVALKDLEPLLNSIVREGIQCEMQLAPQVGSIRIDRSQLAQIILNLVANARDAMPAGGRLKIETANVQLDESYSLEHINVRPGSYVQLSMTDSGSGMDRETISRIFEPFFTTKESGSGLGLGLATVYAIVRQSGGHIWVYSEPGSGTTFKVYLPQVAQASRPTQELQGEETMPEASETILLVEDSTLLAKVAKDYLEIEGYTAFLASNSHEAVEIASSFQAPIHLLLTDLVMPDMNGCQLAEVLMATRPGMKVLYMSGYTKGTLTEDVFLTKDVAFIEKPFSQQALSRKVRSTLNLDMRR